MPVNVMDIKSDKWLSIVARLQRLARTQYINKCKMIRITVIADNDGNPMIWSEPECTPIEPGGGAREWLNQF